MPSFTFYFLCVLVVLILFSIFLFNKRKQFRIQRWQKSLNLHHHEQIFNQLYQHTNGFLLSQQARKKEDAMDYVYGEIEFLSFLALLSLVKPEKHTVFYDLGSGTGKAVLACAMVYPVQRAVGVEILPELHAAACKQLERLALLPEYAEKSKKVTWVLGDFLKVDLSDATFIFINASAFFNPTWEELCARLDHLPLLTTVITTSKALKCNHFTVLRHTKVQMGWGIVLAYIHARKKH